MSTKLEAELALSSIEKHPKNPRHRAIADPDMVASVTTSGLLQPIVVAPHPTKPDKYILIAGHRRIDACKKAKLKAAPAVIRDDLTTEGKQIEAMIIENGHRVDLTPIEEAEGYAQLELLGYKAPSIAAAVGRDVKTVRGRLKLLKLAASTKKKVHEGQLTIEDANAFVEFADDPETTKRLERAASSGSDWEWKSSLKRARALRVTNQKIAVETAKLLDAGAVEIDAKGKSPWQLWNHDLGPTPLTRTHSEDWGQHKGCLGFVHYKGNEYSQPTLDPCCTKPSNHVEKLEESERDAIAEAEKEAATRQEKVERERIAREIRLEHATGLAAGEKLPTATADIVRHFLRGRVRELYDDELSSYQHLVGVPEADRWDFISPWTANDSRHLVNKTKRAQHLETFDDCTAEQLTRRLVAFLLVEAEDNLGSPGRRDNAAALTYFQFLTETGHKLGPVDKRQRAEIATEVEVKRIASEAAAS